MRRRICHSPSRNCGELPLGVSNTKTESHRSQPDRPSPPSPPPCPRRRATATTASTRCPAAYSGSLAYRFTVRRGWACWRLCGLVALETCSLTSVYKQFILSLGFLVGGAVWGDPNLGAWDKMPFKNTTAKQISLEISSVRSLCAIIFIRGTLYVTVFSTVLGICLLHTAKKKNNLNLISGYYRRSSFVLLWILKDHFFKR